MAEKEIRLLRPEEIECRIQSVNSQFLQLLLYKDVRTDIKILTETYGAFGWKKSYQSINNELFCTIEIYDEDKKQWVGKQDIGTPSQAEAEKGRASDAAKRSAVSWLVGLELYSSPLIIIKAGKYQAEQTEKGIKVKDKFHVKEISYSDNREITELVIANQRDEVVFEYKERKKREKLPDMKISIQQINELHQEMNRAGVTLQTVLDRYSITGVAEMTPEIYNKAMRSLKMTNRKAA